MASTIHPPMSTREGDVFYLARIVLVATLGGLLFGYDTAVISGAIGFLQTHFVLDADMKGWAAACALVGCALGAAGAGLMSDRLGRKKVLVLAALLFLASAIGTAVPRTLTQFIVFRILGGFAVGAASMTSPMYIAEVSPARIRGRMVSLNQLAIVSGFLVVYFVNYYIARYGIALDERGGIVDPAEAWNVIEGWRWMFGSEALPALLLLGLLFLVPESPRWLVKQGREPDARNVLTRVGGSRQAEAELAEIREAITQEGGSVAQLLRPGMRIVLVIGIALAVLQQITGINVFLYYAPEIFKRISGEGVDAALLQTIVVGAVNVLFTVIAIWTVDRTGRKPLMLIGFAGMGISLAAMGAGSWFGDTSGWILVFILGYIASFAMSVGPVTWVILSEIFPTRIRGRAMAIATFCLWVANGIITQTFPMMSANEFLTDTFHGAFPFWLYGAFCVVSLWFVWRFVPETKGRTLEEIERFWTRR